MIIVRTKKSFILLLGVIFFLAPACKKGNIGPDIPEAYVNFYLRPNDIDFIPDGGWVYVTAEEPSRGIIIYRPFHDEFRAFERTCPYDPNSCCTGDDIYTCSRLKVDQSGLFIVDSCCSSKYLITDGAPFEGPSPWALKQYQTYYNGDVLHVYN